jgi:Uma2 family endonuclease
MATQATPFCTFEGYLAWERDADYRSEYRAGTIVSVPSGTELHSRKTLQLNGRPATGTLGP